MFQTLSEALNHILSCSVLPDSLWPYDGSAPGSALPMEFFRQGYWNRLPFPIPGDLPHPGIEPMSLTSPALADRFVSIFKPPVPPGMPPVPDTFRQFVRFWTWQQAELSHVGPRRNSSFIVKLPVFSLDTMHGYSGKTQEPRPLLVLAFIFANQPFCLTILLWCITGVYFIFQIFFF